jgi:cytochrome oxidase Cu insertion factor (SCO1/SenC/PrrC family)
MNLKRVFNITFVILLILGWGLFVFQFFKNKGSDEFIGDNFPRGIRIYKEAPEFELTGQDNNKVSLAAFRGKVVLYAPTFRRQMVEGLAGLPALMSG